jgi:hypothetical protein
VQALEQVSLTQRKCLRMYINLWMNPVANAIKRRFSAHLQAFSLSRLYILKETADLQF